MGRAEEDMGVLTTLSAGAFQDLIIIFRKMALLLEFEDEMQICPAYRRSHSSHAGLLHTALSKFAQQAKLIEISCLASLSTALKHPSWCFTQQFPQGLTALYLLTVESHIGKANLRVEIVQEGKPWCVRSTEIIKNICRTVRSINTMASKTLPLLAVDAKTAQLRLSLQGDFSYNHPQTIFDYLRTCLAQTYSFLRSFLPILLRAANLAPRTVLHALPPQLKNLYFGGSGELTRYAEILELLPCVNCALQVEQQQCEDKNSNAKRIIQLYYDQCGSGERKQLELYTEPALLRPQHQVGTFNKNALALNFPTVKDGSNDHPYIFNTITVTNYNKQNERFFSEGGRAKIVACPTRFFYSMSCNPMGQIACKKKKQGDESTAETEQLETITGQGVVELEKMLLVKMPRVASKDKDYRKMLQHLRYEKAILCNLRTVGCAYLPKYYHSVQKGYQYRPFLLMDLVQGNTLMEEMERRCQTATLSVKLHILSHLSNAIRFLEQHQIAHLDLAPTNIVVTRDFMVKLIDFGEAYHKGTSIKFTQEAGSKFVYSPGRTFPYAPPETSQRHADFTNQQDMYSLGVILHQLLFAAFPFTCSHETHKKLYRNGTYNQRLMFAPERAEDYGQADFMAILINLASRMMESDEKRRPHPVWAHIIIKKLFYAIR